MSADSAGPGTTFDVVISGLGPTGLVLSHLLGQRGHRVLVLERERLFYGRARAVYTDDECMRIFQATGVAEQLQAKMLTDVVVQFIRPNGSIMARILPRTRPLGWPIVNFFYQPYLETTLTEELARYPNVDVRRGRELVDFTQDPSGVTVVHEETQSFRFRDDSDAHVEMHGDADRQEVRCRYLVGADGGRSDVRAKLGIEMTGKSFPEPWLVVDLQAAGGADAVRHLPYFNFVVDAELPSVSCVQPDGHHRFEFMLCKGETKESMERLDTVRRLISRHVDPDRFEVKRRLVYTFNALMAQKWRTGRVLLAGDAAHMTPQFMGQGMSSGVRDADNLAWKLDLVLSGKAGDAILDSYQNERQAHAQSMIDASVTFKDLASTKNPVKAALRDFGFFVIRRVPAFRRWFESGGFKPRPAFTNGKYVGLRRRARRSVEGTLAPQPTMRRADGTRVLLDTALGAGFALVGYGVDPLETLSDAGRASFKEMNMRSVIVYPYGARPQGITHVDAAPIPESEELEDVSDAFVDWLRKAGHRPGSVALLRPDRYVFGVVRVAALETMLAELRSQLHWRPPHVKQERAA